MKIAVTIILGYLIGCFSSAYIVGKCSKDIDIRHYGSGNSGTTNALRVMGKKKAAITFFFDVLKGSIASILGYYIGGETGQILGGLFAVIGHNWPIFLDFKGGKGIATSVGVLLIFNWKLTLLSVGIGLIIGLGSRFVSLGSLCFLLSFNIISLIITPSLKDNYNMLLSMILLTLAIVRHRDNIRRLIAGKENKLGR